METREGLEHPDLLRKLADETATAWCFAREYVRCPLELERAALFVCVRWGYNLPPADPARFEHVVATVERMAYERLPEVLQIHARPWHKTRRVDQDPNC